MIHVPTSQKFLYQISRRSSALRRSGLSRPDGHLYDQLRLATHCHYRRGSCGGSGWNKSIRTLQKHAFLRGEVTP